MTFDNYYVLSNYQLISYFKNLVILYTFLYTFYSQYTFILDFIKSGFDILSILVYNN
jgi:hypothetical protein